MERMDLIPELRRVSHGRHICHLLSTEEQRLEVACDYIRTGLEQGEKVVYVGNGSRGKEVRELLARSGLDPANAAARGQFLIYDPLRFFIPAGDFFPRAVLAAWNEEAQRALREGWPTLRVLTHMSWALDRPPGWEGLAEYEAEINRLPEGGNCIFLCQYDRRRFPPELQLDLLRTHPQVIIDREMFDNIYYLPPGEFLENMAPSFVLEHHFQHLGERKRSILQMEEARAFSKAVVDTVREPLLVLDVDLRMVAANRSFYRTFRVTPEETEGKPIYELGNRQWDIPALRELLEEIVPRNTSFEDYAVEHDFPRIGRKVMLLNARRLYREDERTQLILLAMEDITERRAAEGELLRRERYFHRLIENAFDAVTVLDAEGRHVYASPSTERVLGWKPEELLGKTVFEFMHREDLPQVTQAFRNGIRHPGQVNRVIHRWRDPEGNWRIVESSGVNLLDDPYVGGVVINCRDVTQQTLTQRRVNRLNRMFLSLGADFLSNMEIIVQACRDILEGEAAAYARREGEKLALLTTFPGEEGFLLLDDLEVFAGHPLLRGEDAGPLIIKGDKEEVVPGRDPLAVAHGYRCFAGLPVIVGDMVKGVLSVYWQRVHELNTEDLETFATLARTLAVEEERLSREEGLKGFIDVASHELRHPVTIIRGYALTLRERLKGRGGGEEMEMLTAIDEGSIRLVRLVENLLDVSRIERGQLELECRETEVLPLLHRAVAEVGIMDRKVTLRAKGELGACRLDPDRFLEVMFILLDNAFKFSPPGSEVVVEAERDREGYLFSVRDRGAGIPEKERARVFDRFYQVEKPRFHSKPGVGMGLYIAREIVERHGGRIWHEPREGGGSVFRFTIPG
ncbi:MEDS domain-containing protein [Candidatus Solincola sp.]|nr:MEDS domain-containing protein [Actinomycetota bacterium]